MSSEQPTLGLTYSDPFRRLLVMSCSERKREVEDILLPAFELYDGPAFRVVRKYVTEKAGGTYPPVEGFPKPSRALPDLSVIIVSAKHGPIAWAKQIEWDDEKLTQKKAEAMKKEWSQKLNFHCQVWRPSSAFVYGGEVYKLAVPVTHWRTDSCAVTLGSGSMGYQLQQLRHWLIGQQP